jgi:cell division protein FtsW
MKKEQFIYEKPIIYIIIATIAIGCLMLYSASSTIAFNKFGDSAFYIKKHIVRLLISLIAFSIAYRINFKFFKQNATKLLIFSWIIMLLAYFFNEGSSTNRFLIINGKNILTTSDFAKLCLIIFTAQFIENNKNKINNIKILLTKYLPHLLITLLLILCQPDLSSTFTILILISLILITAGINIKYLIYPSISGIVLALILLKEFQKKRFFIWWNGESNQQAENAINALGNGGLKGVGFDNSIIKEGFLPEVHTDFILPVIGEEFGFLGILFMFMLFLSLYFLGIKICKSAPDIFSSMLCLGITLNILIYFLINVSYVVGFIPTTGLAIPFFSYGGSHTLFNLFSLGVLLNISKYTNLYKYKYISYE